MSTKKECVKSELICYLQLGIGRTHDETEIKVKIQEEEKEKEDFVKDSHRSAVNNSGEVLGQ